MKIKIKQTFRTTDGNLSALKAGHEYRVLQDSGGDESRTFSIIPEEEFGPVSIHTGSIRGAIVTRKEFDTLEYDILE